MQTFSSARDAKEFLIGKIVLQAQRHQVTLSETERKMLYFSETCSSLPDIWEVDEVFERDYNNEEYEQKIRKLITSFRKHARSNDRKDFDSWEQAVRTLRREDHYLLLLVDVASGKVKPAGDECPAFSWRHFGSLALLTLAGFVIVSTCLLIYIFVFQKN